MKDLTLKIIINKSAKDVFDFYINPNNTPLWINSIVKEETSDWPIKVGTIYKNKGISNTWNEYVVTQLKDGELFELAMKNSSYHVRYTHKVIDDTSTELTYYEWVDSGELEEPFTMEILQKLKTLLES